MFSPLTQERIKSYVYCLMDPETKEAFYIGKGKGNRVFDHINSYNEQAVGDDSDKIAMIKEIKSRGQEVEHVIIRYGLTEKEALEVEAALIDYAGLDNITNSVRGHSVNRGKISVKELDLVYGAKAIEVHDNLMIIKINALYKTDMNEQEIYEATRKWWVVSEKNVPKVDYVLSVHNGIVRGVFKPLSWHRSSGTNRFEFVGEPADCNRRERYINHSIEKYIKKGQANPIQYLFVDNERKKVIEIEETSGPTDDDNIKISEKAILIKINANFREGMSKEEIYKATRGKWKLSLERAKKADYVFSIANGIIREVFKVDEWNSCDDIARIEFTGDLAEDDLRTKYINRSVKHFYSMGEANPCKYVNI